MATSTVTWPKDVTAERELLPGGVFVYHLSHAAIGRLGRILLTPAPGGGTRLDCEVYGKGSASVIERRRAVLEPLARAVSAKLGGR
ncbi:hypothetical protein LMG23992_04101 [Cupriavidus laharis]|uniref:Uncharacterized protein n=1 Tax=Cupriavidus laharis TaxID=151654 RepID=A0ABM8XIA0_9BURK|nr:hypothetical protein [Cupriavidus laharis]CAG9179879.1 hypothetical protein LMG23992_04101 [Cupriavidus laharis]